MVLYRLMPVVAMFAIAVSLLPQAAEAERLRGRKKWEVGGAGGLNITYGAAKPSGDGAARTGLAIGIGASRHITDLLAIRGELRYSQRGAHVTLLQTAIADFETTLELDYLEFPLLAELRFGSGKWRPTVSAGPALSLAVRKEFEVGPLDLVNVGVVDFKSYDLTLDMGAGVEYVVSRRVRVTAQARFGLGLIDLNNSMTMSYRSRAVTINAGVNYSL